MPNFDTLPTPCLLLDEARMTRNVDRLSDRARELGVTLRPHLKTCKNVEVAHRLTESPNPPVTVSTLAEAEVFADAGFTDILYAVGIAPQKLAQVLDIRSRGCDLMVILDSTAQAEAVVAAGGGIPVLIEIDSDGHRGGLVPDDPALVPIARILHDGGIPLRGVMTHAGESYGASGRDAQAEFAETERAAVVQAAERLRAAGLPCPIVSVGSTPTTHAARDLTDVTEMRAGVYVFFDLVMAGIGVCDPDDIAISVLTTVIGQKPERGWTIVDAGWMAMSRDRGTAAQAVDQGYGLVCNEAGEILPDLILSSANQEHGIISVREGSGAAMPDLPPGTRLRILPNHACATAAQHDRYHVIPADGGPEMPVWKRFSGW